MILGAGRHHPAVEPGQRAFLGNRVADVRAGGPEHLDLLGAVVGEQQRHAVLAEQAGCFFGLRVEAEHIAAQGDQALDRLRPVGLAHPERRGLAQRQRSQREIVAAAVIGEHAAAQARIPQRGDRVGRLA